MPICELIDVMRTIEAGVVENWQKRLKKKEWALKVDVKRVIEGGFIPLLKWTHLHNSCVEKQHVKHPEGLTNLLDNFLLVPGVAHVGCDGDDFVPQFFAGCLQSFWVSPGDGDTCA